MTAVKTSGAGCRHIFTVWRCSLGLTPVCPSVLFSLHIEVRCALNDRSTNVAPVVATFSLLMKRGGGHPLDFSSFCPISRSVVR